MLCKLGEVLESGRSPEQEQKGSIGYRCKRKGKCAGPREDHLQKPHGKRELGVSEQLEPLVGECGEGHSVVRGERPEPDCAGPAWGNAGPL